MSVRDKLAAMRGGGHHIPHGLDEILEDMDKRISALEPEVKEEPKPDTTVRLGSAPHDNPLDCTELKS